jgi:hypothetical protein
VLDLSDTRIGDNELDHVASLTDLLELKLRHTRVTDAGICKLKPLRRLTVLDVAGTAVTYDGLAELEKSISGVNLQEQLAVSRARASGILIDLGTPMPVARDDPSVYTTFDEMSWKKGIRPEAAGEVHIVEAKRLTPSQMEDLRRLTSARSFDSVGAIFPAGGLSFLTELTQLRSVSIDDAQRGNLTDDDLVWIAKLPNLTTLELYSERLTEAGIAHLAKAQSLSSLSLSGNRLTAAAIERLAGAPGLKSLKLRGDSLTVEMLQHLPRLAWLETLNLELSCDVDDGRTGAAACADVIAAARDAMRHLGAIPNLQHLSARGNLMVAEVLEPLKNMPSLVRLQIDGRFVSHASARLLQEAMPHCHVQRKFWVR